jgi:hypothetical protein
MEPPLTLPKSCYQPHVYRVPNPLPGAQRAQWLAELSEALSDAHQLLLSLELDGHGEVFAQELFLRIQAARFEVQSLRLARSNVTEGDFTPKWSQSSPWTESGLR